MNLQTYTAPETEPALEMEIPAGLELGGPNGKRVPASVRRINAGFIQLSSPAYLLKDTRLFVNVDRQRIEVEVAYCKPEEGGQYLVGVRTNPESSRSMRREPRLPLDLPATVTALDFPDPVHSRVVDMSQNGLGLTLPFEIPVGTVISVEMSFGIASGEIRHCTQRSPRNWRVGLCLEKFVPRASRTGAQPRTEETRNAGLSKLLDRLLSVFGRQ